MKTYTHKTSKIVTMKTPKIKFSDVAYISQDDESLQLDLYIAGRAYKTITIDGMVCIKGEGCMRKSSFNDEYLVSGYPDDLLKNVFLGRPIYEGTAMQKSADEFSQTIKNPEVNIRYIVSPRKIYFKDKENHILIKIKDIN